MAIMKLFQNLFSDLISDVNNTPTINYQSVNNRTEIDIGNTIEYDVKPRQVKNDYSKIYKSTHKMIEI